MVESGEVGKLTVSRLNPKNMYHLVVMISLFIYFRRIINDRQKSVLFAHSNPLPRCVKEKTFVKERA